MVKTVDTLIAEANEAIESLLSSAPETDASEIQSKAKKVVKAIYLLPAMEKLKPLEKDYAQFRLVVLMKKYAEDSFSVFFNQVHAQGLISLEVLYSQAQNAIKLFSENNDENFPHEEAIFIVTTVMEMRGGDFSFTLEQYKMLQDWLYKVSPNALLRQWLKSRAVELNLIEASVAPEPALLPTTAVGDGMEEKAVGVVSAQIKGPGGPAFVSVDDTPLRPSGSGSERSLSSPISLSQGNGDKGAGTEKNPAADEDDALGDSQIDLNENIDGKSDIMMNVTAQTSKAALQRVLEGAAAEYMDKKDGYYHARYRGHNKALGRMKAMFSSNFKKSEHQQLMNPLVGGVLPNHTLRKEAFDLIKSTDDAGAALYPKLAAAFSEVDTWVSSMMVTSGQFRAGQEDAQAFLGDLFKLNDGAMLKLMDARQNPVYDGFFKNKAKSPTKTRAAIEKIVVDVCALSDSGRPDPKSEPMKALLRTVLAPEAGTVKAPKA